MPSGYTDARRAFATRLDQLKSDRGQWDPHWLEIQRYVAPDHGRSFGGNNAQQDDLDGSKRMTYIYDSTATQGGEVLAAGFQAGLSRPSIPWFDLKVRDPEMNKRPEVQKWLYDVKQILYASMASTSAYQTFHHTYYERAMFGTAAYGIFEDFELGVHYRPFTCGEYFLAQDHLGRVDTFYRELSMTAAQLVGEFGEANCSKSVVNSFKNGGSERRFDIVHLIEKNDNRVKLPGLAGKKFRSCYYEAGGRGDDLLRMKGYREFPIIAPRWATVGNQCYGRKCPGMLILPDVKQLQRVTEKKLEIEDKLADPPMRIPGRPSGIIVRSKPGGTTYDTSAGAGTSGGGIQRLYDFDPQLAPLMNDIYDLRNQVLKGEYNHLFQMLLNSPSNTKMTAREVVERHEEKLMMLGPTIERTFTEMQAPTIERHLAILDEQEMLPPAPAVMEGQELKIEFISVFAQAMKMAGLGTIEQFVGFVGSVSAIAPQVLDKVDFDTVVEEYADRSNINPSAVIPDEQVAEARGARAQQMAQQQALANAGAAAQAAKVASETDTGGNTVLSTLMGALPGGAGGRPVTPQ